MDCSLLTIMSEIVQILYQFLPVRVSKGQGSILCSLRPILGGEILHVTVLHHVLEHVLLLVVPIKCFLLLHRHHFRIFSKV